MRRDLINAVFVIIQALEMLYSFTNKNILVLEVTYTCHRSTLGQANT